MLCQKKKITAMLSLEREPTLQRVRNTNKASRCAILMLSKSIPLDRSKTNSLATWVKNTMDITNYYSYSYRVIFLPSSVCTALSSTASRPYTRKYNLVIIRTCYSGFYTKLKIKQFINLDISTPSKILEFLKRC